MPMSSRMEKKKLAILEVLKSSTVPLSSRRIAESLDVAGYEISERTIRLYLQQLDQEGLTELHGKKGRTITESGKSEIGGSRILERIGYMSSKIDQMAYQMSFDLARRSGTVVVNTTIVDPEILLERADEMKDVFSKGYAMGNLIGILPPGEQGVPEGKVGFCTVCSVTLNGVMLKHGVPVRSLFCGLLELKDHKPVRFAEVIKYDGTSLDPLELFIRGGKTDYIGAITTGNGFIGIGFRELPADSYDLVVSIAEQLEVIGLGAFMEIGRPGQALFNIPVHDGCIGAIVVGGLNPVAILEERGIRVDATALSGRMEFNRLRHYTELEQAVKQIIQKR